MRSRPAAVVHRHAWLIDPLLEDSTLLIRPMFGGKAVYFRGKFVLFLADRDEPWRGVLLPTERAQQASHIADCASLAPHAILPKWLYLPESVDSFETDAQWLVAQIRQDDDRIGIIPPSKRSRQTRPSAAKKK